MTKTEQPPNLDVFPLVVLKDGTTPLKMSVAQWRRYGPDLCCALLFGGGAVKENWMGDANCACVTWEGEICFLHAEDLQAMTSIVGTARTFYKDILGVRIDEASPLQRTRIRAWISERIAQVWQDATAGKTHVLVLACTAQGCLHYRVQLPGKFMPETVHFDLQAAVSLDDFGDYDVLVLQRQCHPRVVWMAEKMHDAGMPVVYETDDLISRIPDDSLLEADPHSLRNVEHILDFCDAITVSTEPLKAAMGRPEKTFVLPNSLDPADWPLATPHGQERVRIFWAGGSTHEQDLKQVDFLWPTIMKESTALIFMGQAPARFCMSEPYRKGRILLNPKFRDRVFHIPWTALDIYPETYASKGPDIVLAPLEKTPFTDCKSNLRVLEAWAVGCPVVASDVGPYQCIRDGVDGFKCKGDEDWRRSVTKLIRDPALRKRMGAAGRARLESEFNIRTNVALWADLYTRLAEKGEV